MSWRPLALLAGGVCLILAYGCAGSSPTTLTPDLTPTAPGAPSPFGQYVLSLAGEAPELIPIATPQAIGDSGAYDATQYFTSIPCTDCARIDSFRTTPEGLLAIDIALRHPYRTIENRLDLDVFDVRGILGVSGSFTFPATAGILGESLTTQPGLLANADGYTTHFHESLSRGDATLNPFRRFFTESDPSPEGHGEFINFAEMPMASEWDVRRYLIDPRQGTVEFDFIIEASYGQSAQGPQNLLPDEVGGRLNPTYFNPEFNQKEAFATGFRVISAPAADAGGDLKLGATILDWQQGFSVEEFYPFPTNPFGLKASSNVGDLTLEIPGLGIVPTAPTSSAGTGATDDPMLANWVLPIGPQAVGSYPALLCVTDELHDAELLTESRQDLRAFDVRIVRIQESPVAGAIPVAVLTSVPAPASAILRNAEFTFYGSNSYDPDMVALDRWEFDWNYDGSNFDADHIGNDPFEAAPTHRYTLPGNYTLALRVRNVDGEWSDIVTLPVTVTPDPIVPSPSIAWSNGINLSGEEQLSSIGGASDSSIAVAPNGTIHVAWVMEEEGIFLGTDVYIKHVSVSPTGTPGPVTDVYNETILDAVEARSAIGLTASGAPYVAWALQNELFFSQRSGSTWAVPALVAAADEFGGESLGRFDLASSGTTTALVYETLMPENALPARVYVLLRQGSAWGIEANLGTGFGVSVASPGTLWPSLASTDTGFLAIWAGGNGSADTQQDVFLRRYNGTAWSARETIADDPALGEIEPTMAVGPDDSIAIAWRNGAGVFGRIAAGGTTFGPMVELFDNVAGRVHTRPSLVAGLNGAFGCAVLEKDSDTDPGTIVTLAFHKLHSDPAYYGLRTRALAANVGPVYLNADLTSGGQDAIAAVVEAPQLGWNYIRLIRGTFEQP